MNADFPRILNAPEKGKGNQSKNWQPVIWEFHRLYFLIMKKEFGNAGWIFLCGRQIIMAFPATIF